MKGHAGHQRWARLRKRLAAHGCIEQFSNAALAGRAKACVRMLKPLPPEVAGRAAGPAPPPALLPYLADRSLMQQARERTHPVQNPVISRK